MQKRPLSLTIIGWYFAISVAFGLFSALRLQSNTMAMNMLANSEVPLVYEQAWGILGCIVTGACAYGIFKGQPWSRVLYVAWGPISLVVTYLVMPIITIIVMGVVSVVVIAYFLFRAPANQWFAAQGLELRRNEG